MKRAVTAVFSISGGNGTPFAVNPHYFFHSSGANKPVLVGQVTEGTLKVGDPITLKRPDQSDINDVIASLQVNGQPAESVPTGSSVGIGLTNTRIKAVRDLNGTPAKK